MTGKADVSVRLWGSNSLTAILSQPRHSEVVDDTIHLSFPGGLQLWNLKNEKRHLETHIYKGPLGNTLVVCRLVSLWSLLPKKAALWSCLSMRWVAPSPWLQSEKHGSSPRCHQRQKWRCACWSLDDFSQKGSLSTHGLKNPPGLLVSFLRFFFTGVVIIISWKKHLNIFFRWVLGVQRLVMVLFQMAWNQPTSGFICWYHFAYWNWRYKPKVFTRLNRQLV